MGHNYMWGEAPDVADSKACSFLAMIIADRVFREEGNGKMHISGTFNRIGAAKFPLPWHLFHVYLAFTDVPVGKHQAKLTFRYVDNPDADVLCSAQGPIESKDRLRAIEMNMAFQGLVLPRPGTIEIAFFLDDELVGRREFVAVQASRPNQGG